MNSATTSNEPENHKSSVSQEDLPEESSVDSEAIQESVCSDHQENEFVFKELSWVSVLSFAAGIFALISLAFLYFFAVVPALFAILPLLAIILGTRGISGVRKYPDELTGGGFAKTGLVFGLITLISGYSWMAYDYATEVPPGFKRIDYGLLQSEDPNIIVPETALKLNGEKIFIKGFMFPPDYKNGIRKFMLCRDNGDCCFGGQPKLTDMIYINITGENKSTDYHPYVCKVAGTFHVQQATAEHLSTDKEIKKLGQVVYHLDGEVVE